MTVDDGGLEHFVQLFDHVVAPDPCGMVASQPTMRMTQLIVLGDVILIRGKDEGTVILEIDLHDTKTRGVARRVMQSYALVEIEVRLGERLPIEFFEVKVMSQIDTKIGLGGDGPTSMLEFLLVHINGHVRSEKVFETTCMI